MMLRLHFKYISIFKNLKFLLKNKHNNEQRANGMPKKPIPIEPFHSPPKQHTYHISFIYVSYFFFFFCSRCFVYISICKFNWANGSTAFSSAHTKNSTHTHFLLKKKKMYLRNHWTVPVEQIPDLSWPGRARNNRIVDWIDNRILFFFLPSSLTQTGEDGAEADTSKNTHTHIHNSHNQIV